MGKTMTVGCAHCGEKVALSIVAVVEPFSVHTNLDDWPEDVTSIWSTTGCVVLHTSCTDAWMENLRQEREFDRQFSVTT